MVFCIALTGNIATVKSTVSNTFKQYGAEIINADAIAKNLTQKNHPAYFKILEHFGTSILLENEQLDRKQLRHIIFSNPEEKIWLENLLHPLIRQEIEHKITTKHPPYFIIEIPLPFEREDYPYIDRVLLVTSSESHQVTRVMSRDNCTKDEARMMIKNQPSIEERLAAADDVIENNEAIDDLIQEVKELDLLYRKLNSCSHGIS